MTLATGSKLGAYEVLSPLGAGGMGEVYRAKDLRLGREVAVKVLPEALAENRDRLSRFEQEARAASALNHPNIVTIHEIGREGETSYIAMGLVDGRTLRELEASGPLPVRKVLGIAAQVAEGLSKAHSAGIVHLDLKPENVMVSKDGFVGLRAGRVFLHPIDGGEARTVPGLSEPGDRVLQWSADGRSLYVHSPRQSRSKVWLADVETGRKSLWREIPIDEGLGNRQIRVTPDGKTWVYSGSKFLSERYIVEGLH